MMMTALVVRQAESTDAAALVEAIRQLANEPDIGIGLSPGEYDLSPEQQMEILADYGASANSIFLVAEMEGVPAGFLNLKGGPRRSNRHTAVLGMSVFQGWRNRGVGHALMQTALDWAAANPWLLRIELFVIDTNSMAIHLYEKFGFTVEGRSPQRIFRDGQYHTDLLMGLLLEK